MAHLKSLQVLQPGDRRVPNTTGRDGRVEPTARGVPRGGSKAPETRSGGGSAGHTPNLNGPKPPKMRGRPE